MSSQNTNLFTKKKQETDVNKNNWKLSEEALPNHCFQIEKDLPKLQNKEAQNYLQDYALLMCDLYDLQYSDMSSYKETVDALRNAALWLITNKEKLNNKDQKLLNDYLESLD